MIRSEFGQRHVQEGVQRAIERFQSIVQRIEPRARLEQAMHLTKPTTQTAQG